MPKIIRNSRIVDDSWQILKLAEGETAQTVALPDAPVLLPLAVWLARKDEILASNKRSASGLTAMRIRKPLPAIWNSLP